MQNTTLPQIVCEDCINDLSHYVDSFPTTLESDLDPPIQSVTCELCRRDVKDTYYTLDAVKISETIAEELREQFFACDNEGCGRIPDHGGNGYVIDEINSNVLCVMSDLVSSLSQGDNYHKLLQKLERDGLITEITLSGVHCGGCGAELTGWRQGVKAEAIYRMIPAIPKFPSEILDIRSEVSNPADLIDFFRADCSNSLVHLTKKA